MVTIKLTSRPLMPGEFDGELRPSDYQALGEFVSSCSLLEVTMHVVLRTWLGIDERIARGLVGEPRVGDLIDLLKFAYQDQKLFKPTSDTTDALLLIYSRAKYINNVRSIVAHKPCSTDGVALRFHNSLTAKRETGLFAYVCTSSQLSNLAAHTLEVASALRDVLIFAPANQDNYVRMTHERLSSFDKSDLPDPPEDKTPRTARPKRQPPSSHQKSECS